MQDFLINRKTTMSNLNEMNYLNNNYKELSKEVTTKIIEDKLKEMDYLYFTESGNFNLLEQTGLSRLIIIIPSPGHIFESLK